MAGLVNSFGSATTALNKQLGDYANDVEGSWNQPYTFNDVTTYINSLASITCPKEGPVYDALNTTMSASYLKQTWQTILKADYEISAFNSCSCPPVDDSYYASYYAKNPAYFLSYNEVSDMMSFYTLGTGVSRWWPVGGDGALNLPTCGYLFTTFDRTDVFTNWGIPNVSAAGNTPPDPHPPDASFPP